MAHEREVKERQEEAQNAKDEEYKAKILKKYYTRRSEASDDEIITKDRAFMAARKLVEHFK